MKSRNPLFQIKFGDKNVCLYCIGDKVGTLAAFMESRNLEKPPKQLDKMLALVVVI